MGKSWNIPRFDVYDPSLVLYAPLWRPDMVARGGAIKNGTGALSVSPIALAVGANTITVSTLGTFVVNIPEGGTVASGTTTVTGSPVTVSAGIATTITTTGATGNIIVTPSNIIRAKDRNNFPLTVTGATKVPQGYSFDGDDYITIPDNDLFSFTDGAGTDNPFTLIRWVNLTDYTAIRTFIGKRNSATVLEWLLNIGTDGKVVMRLYSGSGTTAYIGQQSSSAISTGVWLCLGMTYNGSGTSAGCILYQNGAVFASAASQNGVYAGMNNTVATVNLGATNAGTANFFIGTDGGAVIESRKLSGNEMVRHFQATKWRYQ